MKNQTRRPFLDADHPMFARVWVRWLVVALPALWTGFELWRGDVEWALLFGATAAYAAWKLLWVGPTRPDTGGPDQG